MALLDFSKTYKPFLYPWAVELTTKHEEIHWVESEAELSEDVRIGEQNSLNRKRNLLPKYYDCSHSQTYR
jgi:ribonucleotide reductase beta subunit family protein with ferritin-like domain